MRIRPSTQIRSRYECVFVLIHFQERFQIDAFTTKTLIVLVWTEGLNASKRMRFQNARAPNEKRRKSEMKRFSFPSLISGLPLDLAFTHDRFAGRSKWRACSLASVYSRHVLEPLTNHNITDHIDQLLCGLGEEGLTLRKRAGRDVKNKIYFCFTWLCLQ